MPESISAFLNTDTFESLLQGRMTMTQSGYAVNKDILTILTKMASKDVKLTEGQYGPAMLGDEDD